MSTKQTLPSRIFRWVPAALLSLFASAHAVTADVELFPGRVIELAEESGASIAPGDFNDDGAIDLAVAHTKANGVGILLGVGDGTFGPAVSYALDVFPDAITAADIDGDGTLDLAVTHRESGDLLIMLGVGDGTFDTKPRAPTGVSFGSLAAGDLNNDGRQDLIVCGAISTTRSHTTRSQCAVMIGSGDGSFGSPSHFLAGSSSKFLLADLDGDLSLDLLSEGNYPSLVSVMLGRGDGTFACPAPSGCPAFGTIISDRSSLTDFAVGDFDNDGRVDVAVGSTERDAGGFSAGGVSFLLAGADGRFASQIDFNPGMASINALAVADLNRDGVQDVVATSHDGEITVFLGCPAGVCVGPKSSGGVSRSIVLGDFDGDGLTDLGGISDSLFVLKGRGDGGFGQRLGFKIGDTYAYLGRIAVQDFNEDGQPDIIVERNYDGDPESLRTFLGLGDGLFEWVQPSVGLDDYVSDLAVGDLNADGHLDVVVRAYPRDADRGTSVSIFEGHGDGTFESPAAIDGTAMVDLVAIGDFNADGMNDLVLAGDDQLSILLGENGGTFRSGGNLGVDVKPGQMIVTDLDSDSRPDLIVADRLSGQIVVLLGSGDGLFKQASNTALGLSMGPLITGDFNGDGQLDLAAGAPTEVACLLGRGDGDFGTPILSDSGRGARAPVAGDFNNDGRLDIAFLTGLGNVGLLQGHGDGSFDPVKQFIAVINPHELAAADFDGDGRLDLVVAGGVRDYGNPDDVWVLLNQGPFPNHPPVARAGLEVRVECSSPAGSMIVLDGSSSADSDSSAGTNDDIKKFRWFTNFGTPSQKLLGSGQRLTATLPLGQHVLTLQAEDSRGLTDRAQTIVTVVDTTPPMLILTATPSLLWPPNHRMVMAHLEWQVNDVCDSAAGVVLASAASSEPDYAPGSGNATADIQDASFGTPDSTVLLRAKRSGNGPGRVYTLTYTATDASGNGTTMAASVTVPHDLSSKSGPAATAAKRHPDKEGRRPATVVGAEQRP